MNTLVIIKGAASAPALDLETLKLDLRISDDSLDSILSTQYIPAAVEWCEGVTKRIMVSRQLQWVVSDFPDRSTNYAFYLPGGKVTAVAQIDYVDNQATTTLAGPSSSPAGTGFQESLSDSVSRIMPAQGESWPTPDSDAIDPVKVTYTAGWETQDDVPEDLKRAMTAYVYGALELDGLLQIRSGYDPDFAEKLASAYRWPFV